MSLFTSFGVGVTGIHASQSGMNTSAHNISNTSTKGYTRQQNIQADKQYVNLKVTTSGLQQVGYGVTVSKIRQIRDEFLDKQYRLETSRESFYAVQYNTATEIEDVFGEMEGVEFQNSLKDLWNSIETLSMDSQSVTNRELFISECAAFVNKAQDIYKSLRDYQINLNDSITQKVDRINEIGEQISALNEKISKSEASNLENANDYRDMRNELMDELAELTYYTYDEDLTGKVSIYIDSAPLVTDTRSYHMGTEPVKKYDESGNLISISEMLTVVWEDSGYGEVYELDKAYNPAAKTDTGSLLGTLKARGNVISNYTDIPVRPVRSDFATEDEYDLAMNEFKDFLSEYNNTTGNSVLTEMQAQLDQVIHQIFTLVNNVFSPLISQNLDGVSGIDKEGNTVQLTGDHKILDVVNCPVGTDDDMTIGTEVFVRNSVERFQVLELDHQIYRTEDDGTQTPLAQEIKDINGNTTYRLYVYNEEDTRDTALNGIVDPDTLYTTLNVSINPDLVQDYALLPVKSNPSLGLSGAYNMDIFTQLISGWDADFAVLDPNNQTAYSIDGYYQALITELGTQGTTWKSIQQNQEILTQELEEQRQQVQGVSSEEEMVNLLQYQHAYNAASRYITVIDSMLEFLIERLG